MEQTLEQTAMRKVHMRLLPFSVLCMFVCYLDRVNVGFAALTMNKDLGLSAYFFGLGAGAFYGGYCLFEVPSNLVLERVGARFWIARIMITWGLLAGAMAFVKSHWAEAISRARPPRGTRDRFSLGWLPERGVGVRCWAYSFILIN